MKSLIKYVATILAIFTSLSAMAQIAKAELRATGLTCSTCSNAINKQLKSLPEVVSVQTDLNTNTFVVTLKEGNILTPKVFKEKVENAGFFIGLLLVTVNQTDVNNSQYIKINKSITTNKTIQIQILDKGYVTQKEYKKLSKSFKEVATYTDNNEDNFHFKIIN